MIAEKIEVTVDERRALTAGEDVRIEPNAEMENAEEMLTNAHFQHLESEMSRRGCILLVRDNSSANYSLTHFTYNDLRSGNIMLSVSKALGIVTFSICFYLNQNILLS